MDKSIKLKNEVRLKDSDTTVATPQGQIIQEGMNLLTQMAAAYFGSGAKKLESIERSLGQEDRQAANNLLDTNDSNSVVIIIDEKGSIESFDLKAEKFFDRPAQEVLGKNIQILLDCSEEQRNSLTSDITSLSAILQGCRKEGAVFPIKLRITPFLFGGKSFFTVLIHNVSEQVDSSEKQHKIEARFRNLVEQIPAVTFTASFEEHSHELYVSPQIESLLGFSPKEWISDPIQWYHHIYPEDRSRISTEFARTCIEGTSFRGEYRVITRDRRVLWIHCEARMVRDNQGNPLFLQGVGFDITETKSGEEKVRASLHEKEVLLKEIHHRVKNNLQITSSLLRLQASKIKDDHALSMFKESEQRIRSIALVHEKLYQSEDLARVDFAEYIRDLCTHLARFYNLNSSQVTLRLDLESVNLGIDQAVPCALILNELISNSIKHAFPLERKGEIFISFHQIENKSKENKKGAKSQIYELCVKDTGPGFPKGFDWKKAKSLGLRLITDLTNQIGGKISLREESSGTDLSVVFTKQEKGLLIS
ncbi:MAG: histidine kinase dimerization/phosphoacceptor domain -containing protein, partial [Bdellovibrionia bacterium]